MSESLPEGSHCRRWLPHCSLLCHQAGQQQDAGAPAELQLMTTQHRQPAGPCQQRAQQHHWICSHRAAQGHCWCTPQGIPCPEQRAGHPLPRAHCRASTAQRSVRGIPCPEQCMGQVPGLPPAWPAPAACGPAQRWPVPPVPASSCSCSLGDARAAQAPSCGALQVRAACCCAWTRSVRGCCTFLWGAVTEQLLVAHAQLDALDSSLQQPLQRGLFCGTQTEVAEGASLSSEQQLSKDRLALSLRP